MAKTKKHFYGLTLWYRPSRSMRRLLEAGRGHSAAVVVAAFFGVGQGVPVVLKTDVTWPVVVGGGAIVGVIGLFLFAGLLRGFGRWFGGQAKSLEVRTALGLSLLPWTLFFAVFSFLILGNERNPDAMGWFPLFFAVFIYGFVVLLLSLAAALQLSPLKIFACLAAAFLVSVFPLTIAVRLLAGWMSA